MSQALDTAGLVCILAGALLSLAAAIGLLRFPELLSRMHAGTKPQVLGVLLTLVGVGLSLRSGLDIGMLVVVALFQGLTIPIGAHMVGRAAYRTDVIRETDLAFDELSAYGDDWARGQSEAAATESPEGTGLPSAGTGTGRRDPEAGR
ncbi:MAG TPA: monovalent cation/H(+) antiporter subunit G [Actinomycetales bacterium]|nr:monovalent cation/H(+) antiporter subunit G [Actinomycetales bacterium]